MTQSRSASNALGNILVLALMVGPWLFLPGYMDLRTAHTPEAVQRLLVFDRKNTVPQFCQTTQNPNLRLPTGQTLLQYVALELCDASSAKTLLARKADPNLTDSAGNGTLSLVIQSSCPGYLYDKRTVASALLMAGANPNKTANAKTPLLATLTGSFNYESERKPIVEDLLRAGADPNLLSPSSQESPLALALAKFSPRDWPMASSTLDLLLRHNATFLNEEEARKGLMMGIEHSSPELVQRSCTKLRSLNFRYPETGTTPLISSSAEIAELLLKAGADPNYPDAAQTPPLIHAVLARSTSHIEVLLRHGANTSVTVPYAKIYDGTDGPPIPLFAAVFASPWKANKPNANTWPVKPLSFEMSISDTAPARDAELNSREAVVKVFLDHGVPVDEKTKSAAESSGYLRGGRYAAELSKLLPTDKANQEK